MKTILESIVKVGGKPYLIGGCVRDELMGFESKDIDIEVFGIDIETLINVLSRFGKVDVVGKSFGVVKLTTQNQDYDFSIPRTESKVGVGHKGFEVKPDSSLTIEEASKRRDFTINAISKDIEGKYVDPYGGVDDINNKILRHTSSQFEEDSLRVLRAFQFCGRFDLIAHPSTLKVCKELRSDFENISKERVWTEFEKWAMKSVNPKAGLDFLVMSGWVKCFPELYAMVYCAQDKEWHPEGYVYTHTAYVCNAMQEICERENITGERKLVLMLSALCHDLGKPDTTCWNKQNRISAPGHDKVGGPITKNFLLSINCPHNIIDKVVPLVEQHMAHLNGVTDTITRKISVRLGKSNILDLVLLMEADASGRPPLPKKCPENAIKLRNSALRLGCEHSKPERLVQGGMLLDVIPPCKDLGLIVDWLYVKQLEGKFFTVEDGVRYANHHPIYHKHLKAKNE